MPEGMVGYEEDLFLWSQQQAKALREAAARGVNLPIDWENVAEEIESLGKGDRRALGSRLQVIVEHLLKLEHSTRPDPRRGWRETVRRERAVVEQILEESPSLRAQADALLRRSARKAQEFAARSLQAHDEPDAAESVERLGARYTIEQVIGDWWPAEQEPY